jgi:hypothetical protein
MMKRLIGLALLTTATTVMALEVDEKLTMRVLKTSETKKTIMINRGTDDGLVEGDHARFIVTAGIVARAVCVKVSPARSVWAVYRLVNADFILPDAVMTLKITPAVKITKDESQAIVQEDTPVRVSADAPPIGVPLAEGANDLDTKMDNSQLEDMRALEVQTITQRNIEIYSVLSISGLSATAKSTNESYKTSQASHHITIGGEYYPVNERSWYSRFSLFANLNLERANSQAYNGASASNDAFEFGGGANWHPWTRPSAVLEFIPFFSVSANFGSVKSKYSPGSELPAGVEQDADGTSSGFAVGFGYKFYTAKGFGARAVFDYYQRVEAYGEDSTVAAKQFDKTVNGPRLMLGLSYRF